MIDVSNIECKSLDYGIIYMTRTIKKVQLPYDFASSLLELEIEFRLATQPATNIIKNLVSLYTLGVEYYESIKSHKYLYFQLKMTDVFNSFTTRPPAEEQSQPELPAKPSAPCNKNYSRTQEKQEAPQKHQKEKMFQEMRSKVNEMETISTMRKLLSDNEEKSKSVCRKVNQELITQDTRLKQKLERRKSKILSSKSFSCAGFKDNDTKDTLFSEVMNSKNQPIEANFGNVIKENQSDEEAEVKVDSV